MVEKTKGIVISKTNYSESSLIVRILTKEFGLKSYIIKGGRNPKNKLFASLFFPLRPLSMEVYNNPKRDLNIISEAKPYLKTNTLYENPIKTSMVFFIVDILRLSIREEERNQTLYDFLETTIISLENLEEDFSVFNLVFLLDLSDHLGLYPMNNHSNQNRFFNLQKGKFTNLPGSKQDLVSEQESRIVSNLIKLHQDKTSPITRHSLNKQDRETAFNVLIKFYQSYIIDFYTIKSLEVLRTLIY